MVQSVFHPRHIQIMLGIKRGVYYKIVKQGLLPYTRLYDGGPRVHLPEHLRAYEAYLKRREVKRE